MPRPKTVHDDQLLEVALGIVHRSGPAALTFAALAEQVGLAGSTVVQRFGTKPALLRAALVHAWDRLDAATAAADRSASLDAAGTVDLLVALSGQYAAADFADQLLVLREDFRDPVLRARGQAWIATLAAAIERRLVVASGHAGGADEEGEGIGELIVAHWQGTLTVWGFTRSGPLPVVVRRSLEQLLERLIGRR